MSPGLRTDEQSTSAQLRATQGALAASQADLTKACRERDVLKIAVGQARVARQHIEYERDLARAELASARQELALLRATHVPHSHTDVPHTQETS